MAKFFAGMDIGQMDFYRWHTHGGDGIPERDAGVGIGGGIQDDHVELALGFLYPSHQLAFEVGLVKLDSDLELRRTISHFALDVSQGGTAIDLGFPLAEEVQVGPVQK